MKVYKVIKYDFFCRWRCLLIGGLLFAIADSMFVIQQVRIFHASVCSVADYYVIGSNANFMFMVVSILVAIMVLWTYRHCRLDYVIVTNRKSYAMCEQLKTVNYVSLFVFTFNAIHIVHGEMSGNTLINFDCDNSIFALANSTMVQPDISFTEVVVRVNISLTLTIYLMALITLLLQRIVQSSLYTFLGTIVFSNIVVYMGIANKMEISYRNILKHDYKFWGGIIILDIILAMLLYCIDIRKDYC